MEMAACRQGWPRRAIGYLIIAFAVGVLCTCGGVTETHAQISPGELAEPHKSLEGVTKCLSCHALGSGPSAEKCLECHKEIMVQLDKKHGFHYRTVSVEKRACFECHGEHAGRDFELVHWQDGMERFDHSQTGFMLEGKHASVKCRDCHKAALITSDRRKELKDVDLARTFLGLGDKCLSCHEDEHRGQLSPDCLKCHGLEAWKPVARFDHAKARFRLTGKHRDVACAKCHSMLQGAPVGKTKRTAYVKYVGIEFKQCVSCHKDVHNGKFGSDCERCHKTTGWREFIAGSFDHSKTRFPLKGRHASVACEKCHRDNAKTKKLVFDRCEACHEDVHRGQFTRRADKGACEGCHSEDGFTPARFTVLDHEKTRYPLTGAHLAQPCVSCHKEEKASGGVYHRYTFKETNCEACHQDVHMAQFKKSKPVKDCETCHRTPAWNELVFNHDKDTTYPLEGAHRRVSCEGCHKTVFKGTVEYVRYRRLDHACKACHAIENLKLNG
jgi:hypothetical protein